MALRCVTKGRGPEGGRSSLAFLGQPNSLCTGAADSSKPQRDQGQVQRERGSGFCIFVVFYLLICLERQ